MVQFWPRCGCCCGSCWPENSAGRFGVSRAGWCGICHPARFAAGGGGAVGGCVRRCPAGWWEPLPVPRPAEVVAVVRDPLPAAGRAGVLSCCRAVVLVGDGWWLSGVRCCGRCRQSCGVSGGSRAGSGVGCAGLPSPHVTPPPPPAIRWDSGKSGKRKIAKRSEKKRLANATGNGDNLRRWRWFAGSVAVLVVVAVRWFGGGGSVVRWRCSPHPFFKLQRQGVHCGQC